MNHDDMCTYTSISYILHIKYIIHIHISTFLLVHLHILLSTWWTKSCCKFKQMISPSCHPPGIFPVNRFLNSTADKESIPATQWSVVSSADWRYWVHASWLGTDPSPNQLIIFPSDYPFISHCSFAYHWELPGYLTFFHHKMRFF